MVLSQTNEVSSSLNPVNAKPADALVTAKKIGVRSGDKWLIKDLDLRVFPGEIVTLVGPNGGGKSTSVKALLGLIAIEQGTIVNQPGLTVGYVPQQLVIEAAMPLSVRRFMRLTHNLSEQELNSALQRTGINSLVDSPVQALSGGEFQRVQLARAVARKPELLILDEPVQGVDFQGELALYELIGEIRDELHCGILLVSHDLHIVMAKTDRVLCLNGHVCCQGSPSAVQEDDAYKNLFGLEEARLIGVYHHDHDHSHDIHDHCIPNDQDANDHDKGSA